MTDSSLRALARVAWRDIARHRGRSVLVTLLVLLPVAAMVAGISIFRTMQPTPEREAIARMGRADLQALGVTRATLDPYLPDGSVVEPVTSTDGRIVLPGARPIVSVRALDVDGLAAGMLTLIEGRAPSGVTEIAITPAVAELATVGIGGQLELQDAPATATVVGIVENPLYLSDRVIVFDPHAVEFVPDDAVTWLIGLPEGSDPQAIVDAATDPETGAQEFFLQSRTSGRIGMMGGDTWSGAILILGSLALVEASLIASAAFAVSIRRRQRELGLLAAAGATPRQLAGTVVAEAAILGLIACLAGVVVGLLGAFALYQWLDELTQRRGGPLIVDLGGAVVPFAIGFVAAMLAAIVPARTVGRVPVLLALSGRRPPEAKARRTLGFGLVAVGIAATMTVAGATMRNAGSDTFSVLLLIGGAVLSTLGFGACGPWLLEHLERVAVRLPLAGRIAFRDTARARARSSPIVTAILAGCAALIAIGAWTASWDAENLSEWVPSLYPDQLLVAGTGAVATGEELLGQEGIAGGAPLVYLLPESSNTYIAYELPDARDANGKPINLAERCIEQGNCDAGAVIPFYAGPPGAAIPELIALAHAESATEDLAAGRAVVLTNQPITATTLRITIDEDPGTPEGAQTFEVPVRVIVVPVPGGTLPGLFLPAATISGLPVVPTSDVPDYGETSYVVQFDHPVTEADLGRVGQIAARYPDTMAATLSAPDRPGEGFRFVLIALVLLFAVSVTGIAIALGEAESRSEQRSLLALGSDPGLRRRIAAARAAVLALLAGILAVPAGLLPIWGVFASRGSPLAVPTLEIAGVVLALPILAVVSSWLLSRPIPDWAAFRSLEAP